MSSAIPIFVVGAIVVVAILLAFGLRRARPEDAPDRAELAALQNAWRAPAELLAGPIPRPVRLTGEAKVLVAFAAGVLVTGAFISAAVFRSTMRTVERQREVESETVLGDAQIIRKLEDSEGKRPAHYVFYRFEADGRTYLGKTVVSETTYRKLREGDRVPVRYLAANPESHRLFADDQATPPWPLAFVPAFFAMMVWALTRAVLVQRKLLEWGQPAAAMVTNVPTTRRSRVVHYRFLDTQGDVVSGSTQFDGDPFPEPRSTVTVLFDPRNPRRNALYPTPYAKLVRPESAAPG